MKEKTEILRQYNIHFIETSPRNTENAILWEDAEQAMDTHAEQVAEKKLSDFIEVLKQESRTYLYMNEILILFNLFTTIKEDDGEQTSLH
jgi:hypothetical protein